MQTGLCILSCRIRSDTKLVLTFDPGKSWQFYKSEITYMTLSRVIYSSLLCSCFPYNYLIAFQIPLSYKLRFQSFKLSKRLSVSNWNCLFESAWKPTFRHFQYKSDLSKLIKNQSQSSLKKLKIRLVTVRMVFILFTVTFLYMLRNSYHMISSYFLGIHSIHNLSIKNRNLI